MTNSNKMTKLQVVEMMLKEDCISANEVYKAYLENEKSLLIKKRDNKKETKTQIANEDVKTLIVKVLIKKPNLTITEIQNADDRLKTYSNQKISALVTQLKNDNIVTKVTEKGKSLFSIVNVE